MALGDFLKAFLRPFVVGTKYEHCEECEKRRSWLNKRWFQFISFFKK